MQGHLKLKIENPCYHDISKCDIVRHVHISLTIMLYFEFLESYCFNMELVLVCVWGGGGYLMRTFFMPIGEKNILLGGN